VIGCLTSAPNTTVVCCAVGLSAMLLLLLLLRTRSYPGFSAGCKPASSTTPLQLAMADIAANKAFWFLWSKSTAAAGAGGGCRARRCTRRSIPGCSTIRADWGDLSLPSQPLASQCQTDSRWKAVVAALLLAARKRWITSSVSWPAMSPIQSRAPAGCGIGGVM
jgi:hypothetical protein